MTTSRISLITMGECMVEFYSNGELGKAERFNKTFGGDTLNVAVAFSRLGLQAGFITKVGNDCFGNFLIESWKKEKIDIQCVKKINGFNGIYFISLKKNGQRDFTYYRKGSAPSFLSPFDISKEYIKKTKIVYTSGITQAISESSRNAVKKILKTGKKLNKITGFDVNYRSQLWDKKTAFNALLEILPYIDYLFLSYPDDFLIFPKIKTPKSAIKYFLEKGIKNIIVKCGKAGSIASNGNKIKKIKPLKVKIVDTTGAGDAFNGGFFWGLIKGYDFFDCVKIGNIVAGLKIRGRGAIKALPLGEHKIRQFFLKE